jgi:hypothetical protein
MRKILIIVFLMISAVASAQLSTIGVGASANDGTGDPLRTAFQKTNLAITQVNALKVTSDSIVTALADTIAGSTLYPSLNDTIPLFTFGVGAGLTADTALFNNGVLIGSFYNEGSDTLIVTQLMGVMKEGTGTETIKVAVNWHTTFLSASADSLNTIAAMPTITSLTTGTEDTSFKSYKIPPNVFVWGILSGASTSNKPTFLSVTISGHKHPTY